MLKHRVTGVCIVWTQSAQAFFIPLFPAGFLAAESSTGFGEEMSDGGGPEGAPRRRLRGVDGVDDGDSDVGKAFADGCR
jgi:hypothetical protein